LRDLLGGHGAHRGLNRVAQLGQVMCPGRVFGIRPGKAVELFAALRVV
jgi:hypothetical protein